MKHSLVKVLWIVSLQLRCWSLASKVKKKKKCVALRPLPWGHGSISREERPHEELVLTHTVPEYPQDNDQDRCVLSLSLLQAPKQKHT